MPMIEEVKTNRLTFFESYKIISNVFIEFKKNTVTQDIVYHRKNSKRIMIFN